MDYFGARYYAGALGRFTSPDPGNAGADLYNPQGWNGYAYVLNNPLVNVDPSGMDCVTFDNGSTGDDGQGQACAGSQTAYQLEVSGSTNQQVSSWSWWWTHVIGISGNSSNSGGSGATNGGDASSGGGQGGSQTATASDNPPPPPNNGKTVAQKLACAAKFGQDHSMGALFGGGKVAMFFGGNTVSGLANVGLALAGNGQGPDPTSLALKGRALGVPVNDALRLAGKQTIPELGSIGGYLRTQALSGVFNAATSPGTLTTLSGEVALQGGISAAEYASGAALAKFVYDGATFLYGYFGECQ